MGQLQLNKTLKTVKQSPLLDQLFDQLSHSSKDYLSYAIIWQLHLASQLCYCVYIEYGNHLLYHAYDSTGYAGSVLECCQLYSQTVIATNWLANYIMQLNIYNTHYSYTVTTLILHYVKILHSWLQLHLQLPTFVTSLLQTQFHLISSQLAMQLGDLT